MPRRWHEIHEQLVAHAHAHSCTPPSPPVPLILNGWVYSDDSAKKVRWEETRDWARNNGCASIVAAIPDRDYYEVEEPST
jgi:hypothetical protein